MRVFLAGPSNQKQERCGSNDGGHAARIEPRRRGLSDEISEGSTVVRLTGRATGSYAQAALPKSIRLFDKVT
jgi:hypothetical protein